MANPEKYISKNTPSFLIQHGRVDRIVPIQQSIDFAAKLETIVGKKSVSVEIIEGADHLDLAFNTPENLNKVMTFLDEHLK